MEQITRVTRFPQTKPHIPSLWLPPYLLVVLVLVGGFSVVILSIRLLPQTAAPPDPFVSFADMFSGQSKNDLEAQGFLCSSADHNYVDSPEEVCVFDPPTGIFSTVAVSFVDGVSYGGFLFVREGTLSIGDLVRLWGRPHIYQYGFWGQLKWPGSNGMDLTVSYKGHYSLFLPVGSIVFMSVGSAESGV